jgi:hypothetical protein
MWKWLAAVSCPFVMATAAHAQIRGVAPADVASVARAHGFDLRIAQQQGIDRPLPLIDGMLAQQDFSPNTYVGVGLANMYSRKKRSLGISTTPTLSKKPAVTFVLKF